MADLPAPATLAIFAQHLRRLWAQVQHRIATEFPPNLTPNEAALLIAGALSVLERNLAHRSAGHLQTSRARFNELREAQAHHAGPHPIIPLLEV